MSDDYKKIRFPESAPKEPGMICVVDYERGEAVWVSPSTVTLRDYFAAAALQGLCANTAYISLTEGDMAEFAYRMADAMLEAREGGDD